MDTAEIGRNPVSKHQIEPEYGDEHADAGRDCRTVSRDQISGANGDRKILIFTVQLTTVDPYILLLYVMTIHTAGKPR